LARSETGQSGRGRLARSETGQSGRRRLARSETGQSGLSGLSGLAVGLSGLSGLAVGLSVELVGQLAQEQTWIAQHAQIGPAVFGQILLAAVGRDVEGAAADVAAIVQAKVAGHAGQQHEVGLAQRVAALVAHLQGMIATQQAARHAGQIDRCADALQRGRHLPGARRVQRGLAADDQDRALRLTQPFGRLAHLIRGGRRRRDVDGWPGLLGVSPGKEAVDVPAQIGVGGPLRQRLARPRRAIELAHHGLIVEQIHRALHKDGAGRAALRLAKGLLQRGHQLPHPAHRLGPFDHRGEQRHLVDVLQRAAALQRGRRCAADQHYGGLRHLGVLDRGQGVGDAGAGCDRGHARPAGKARRGVGGEDRGGLVACVHDANAGLFGRHQDGRDVPAHQGVEEFDSLSLQDRCCQFAAVHGDLQGCGVVCYFSLRCVFG
jgi:hypothetical protein